MATAYLRKLVAKIEQKQQYGDGRTQHAIHTAQPWLLRYGSRHFLDWLAELSLNGKEALENTMVHFKNNMALPRQSIRLTLCWLALLGLFSAARGAWAQDLLNDNLAYSPFNLELRPYATLPVNDRRIIGMITRSGDPRLYVTTEGGRIFTINKDAQGNTTPESWFDVASAAASLGHPLSGGASQLGLQSVAPIVVRRLVGGVV
jgi:hypothetical protein